MKNDIYDETKKLVILLNNESIFNSDVADDITNAIDYSATSGEMLMKLKYYLGHILSDKSKYSSELINLASSIHSDVLNIIG
ncbi:hypothetical protein EJP617_35830 [Erwinia sp. Ejp617]|nr:hypothetical protein [Erwinia sp. Ejp617]ADP11301.1 hypothetical protein EJP617_16200 [Erwinia sp. Ejp617]ADP13264.1 hypothetical protein EJP617_35830 [Erwinia sp. Ejp617]